MSVQLTKSLSPQGHPLASDTHFSRLATETGNMKADPNVAMTERTGLEDWQARGTGEDWKPFLTKDVYGRDISDPDYSNPTRSRYERPLETIRSFEAAAYGRDLVDYGAEASGNGNNGMSREQSRLSMRPGNGLQHRQSTASGYSAYTTDLAHEGPSGTHSGSGSSSGHGPRTPQRSSSVVMPSMDTPSVSTWDARTPQTMQYQQQAYASPQATPGAPGAVGPNNNNNGQQGKMAGQRLTYGMPPTPPRDQNGRPLQQPQQQGSGASAEKEKKKGFRLSFGKRKD